MEREELLRMFEEEGVRFADNQHPNSPDNIVDEHRWIIDSEAYKAGEFDAINYIFNERERLREQRVENEWETKTLIPLGEVNLNGRLYQDNENLREKIDEFNERVNRIGVVYGELGYSGNADTSLRNCSHAIRNVRIEDNKVIGDIKILNTPRGVELRSTLNEMVIRPRSFGDTHPNGTVTIKKILSFDAISSEEDSFNPDNIAFKFKWDNRHLDEGRIISDIDPYGEENWNV